MIWTILFYYLIIFITLYLWWLIFFRSYHNSDNNTLEGTWKKGDKVRFPLWQLILSFPICFVPGLNILLLMGQIGFMLMLSTDKDVEFQSFLFKKI